MLPAPPHCDRSLDCVPSVHSAVQNPPGMSTSQVSAAPHSPSIAQVSPARNRQCRGICFQIGDMPSQGQCGSHIDLTVTPRCPDAPERIAPEAPTDDSGERLDNLGECLFKTCGTNADCTAPLTCLPAMNGAPPTCGYR